MNILDLHTHTLSSGHAYSTLMENIQGAKANGLKVMGMSDHAPAMPGAPHDFHFHNLRVIPREIDGIKILRGIECNIIDLFGSVDITDQLSKNLDYVIASLHPPVLKPGNKEENTNTIITAMSNPKVIIIGHPDDARYPLDYEKVVLASKSTKTLLEINNASLNPEGSRVGGYDNIKTILELCIKHQVPVILGSDAHIQFDVGNFYFIEPVLKELNFPQALVINNDINKLNKYSKLNFEL